MASRPAERVPASDGTPVLAALVAAIHENASRLSQLDGATGDGDHGINMDKGFRRTAELLAGAPVTLAAGLTRLGTVLLTEIGGAMGPLYGSFYLDMAATLGDAEWVDADLFERMLDAGIAAILDLGGAKAGDKTLLDALLPAQSAYRDALAEGSSFGHALDRMATAAERGSEATRDMVARVGRASRLGERSRGSLDAGSVSCALQLRAIADAMRDMSGSAPTHATGA